MFFEKSQERKPGRRNKLRRRIRQDLGWVDVGDPTFGILPSFIVFAMVLSMFHQSLESMNFLVGKWKTCCLLYCPDSTRYSATQKPQKFSWTSSGRHLHWSGILADCGGLFN